MQHRRRSEYRNGLAAILVCSTMAAAQTTFLDNGTIRVGAALYSGGAISYLSLSGSSSSVVNIYDLGRYIQQSFYSGPTPFIPAGATQHPAYAGWGWNPVQAGDVYGYRSRVLEWSNDGSTIYVKCVPKQWALNNVDSECTLEMWVTLDANCVHVHNRLTNARSDTTQYAARNQELPAVYTVGTLSNLYTYTGGLPFTGKPLTKIVNSGPPWAGWNATEHWAALVNESNWGLGVYHPGATAMTGGFHGTPGSGWPYSSNTGYIAPLRTEILDHNIVYDYDYTLILGTLDEIRSYVYAHRPDLRPNHVFEQSRRHWYYAGASDDGLSHADFLRVNLGQSDPQMFGPTGFWQAADAGLLRVQAAFRTSASMAEIRFATPHDYFSDAQRVAFEVIPDGQVRTYEVNLAAHPLYQGLITGLRFDPVNPGTAGDGMDIHSITSAAAGMASDNVIEGVGVRASSALNCCGVGDRRARWVVNGGGLGPPVGLRQNAHSGTPSRTMWLSHGTFTTPNDLNPEIVFDLHARYNLESVQIWNYNEAGLTARGIKSFQIRLSDDGVAYDALPGVYTLLRSPGGTTTDISQMISLPAGTVARYVKFDVETVGGVSNHGGDYSFVGLSEVRFCGTPAAGESRLLFPKIHSVSSSLAGFDRKAPYVLQGHDLFGDTHGTDPEGAMWLSQGNAAGAAADNDPEITFDMGTVVRLSEMRVWNYNEAGFTGRGIRTADVLVAGENGLFSPLYTAKSFDRAPGNSAGAFGQGIDLGNVAARYVKLDISSNWGDADPAFSGLSKVQFFAAAPSCPVPAADTDGDLDVDGVDFGVFASCFNGAGNTISPGCECLDGDGDFDVDGADFGIFSTCFNGADNPPGC